MKKPTLSVKDIDGIEYRLLSTRMVEQGDEREVVRAALKKSLKTTQVEYAYLDNGPVSGHISVDVFAGADLFQLGCRRFTGVDAKKLLKWAKGE